MPCTFDELGKCTKCGREVPAAQRAAKWACVSDRIGLATAAAGLAAAAFRHLITGGATVDHEEFERRTAICSSCCHLLADGSCAKCRCPVAGAVGLLSKRDWKTTRCPTGRWHRPRWITAAERTAATLSLAAKLPADLAGIVGVPRSGMAPAGIIAEALHLPLWTLSADGLRATGAGWRLLQGRTPPRGPLLVVDDTMASGRSYRLAQQQWQQFGEGRRALWAVIYRNPAVAGNLLDYWAEDLPLPHLLAWNFPNSHHAEKTAFDAQLIGRDFLPRRWPARVFAFGESFQHQHESLAAQNIAVAELELLGEAKPEAKADALAEYYDRHRDLEYLAVADEALAKSVAAKTARPVICPPAAKVY